MRVGGLRAWPASTSGGLSVVLTAVVVTVLWGGVARAAEPGDSLSVIAQGKDVDSVAAAVQDVGGRVTRRLAIIKAVAAEVTPTQREELAAHPAVERVWVDGDVEAQEDGEEKDGDG